MFKISKTLLGASLCLLTLTSNAAKVTRLNNGDTYNVVGSENLTVIIEGQARDSQDKGKGSVIGRGTLDINNVQEKFWAVSPIRNGGNSYFSLDHIYSPGLVVTDPKGYIFKVKSDIHNKTDNSYYPMAMSSVQITIISWDSTNLKAELASLKNELKTAYKLEDQLLALALQGQIDTINTSIANLKTAITQLKQSVANNSNRRPRKDKKRNWWELTLPALVVGAGNVVYTNESIRRHVKTSHRLQQAQNKKGSGAKTTDVKKVDEKGKAGKSTAERPPKLSK